MTTNPYAPPTAVVDDVPTPLAASAEPPFFAVSLPKLVVLSLCTLGLYELFWFYRNWQRINVREQYKLNPVLRTFFSVIFCYACFSRIREHGSRLGVQPPLAAGALAAGWIVTTILWKLPDPFWLISLLAVSFMLPVQAYANRVNAATVPDHDPNRRFTGWNWFAVVVGGGLLVLAILGSFVPE